MKKYIFLAIALSTVFLPRISEASYTYYWTQNPSLYAGSEVTWSGSVGAVSYVIQNQYSSVGDYLQEQVNFIDLKVARISDYVNEPLYLVVCLNSCNSNTGIDRVIATSTAFSTNEMESQSGYTGLNWFRVRFTTPWNVYLSSSDVLHFYVYRLSSNSPKFYWYRSNVNDSSLICSGSNPTCYTSGFRIGYDDSLSLDYPEIRSYSPSEGQVVPYVNGIYDWEVTFFVPDNGRNWWLRAVDEYQEATTSTEYPKGSKWIAFDGPYSGGSEYTKSASSSFHPAGLYSSYFELVQYVDGVGTTTVSRSAAFNWVFGTSSSLTGDFEWPSYYEPSGGMSLSSTTGCTWWYGMDIPKCVSFLVVPDRNMMASLFDKMISNTKILFPFNLMWGISDVFVGTNIVATSSLPSLAFTVPTGWPAAGATLDLTPWQYLGGNGSILSTANEQGDSFWGVVMPPLRTLIWTGFAFWVFFRLLTGGILGEFNSLLGSGTGILTDYEERADRSRRPMLRRRQ